MAQERLFRLAVEAGAVTFWHVPREGWHLQIRLRRGDEPWQEVEGETYDHLTTVELLDVVASHLDEHL